MKKNSNISVKTRVSLMMGLASLVIMTCICFMLVVPLRKAGVTRSAQMAQTEAMNAGLQLAEHINGAADVVRAFSAIIELTAESEFMPREKRREFVLAEMTKVLSKGEKLGNMWCTLEPNALDGMDAFFANRPGNDANGIFSPWFTEDGELSETEDGAETDYASDYYNIPKITGSETITEPYWEDVNGKKIHMFSFAVPIYANKNFIGVVGVDFDAADMYSMMKNYNGNVTGKLVTSKGTIAVCENSEQIGKFIDDGSSDIRSKISQGKLFEGFYIDSTELYKVFVPIQLGNGTKPWFYAVEVPRAAVYAQANYMTRNLAIYCSIGVLLIMLAGWILIAITMKDVTRIASIIRKLSLGQINLKIDSSRTDEIGQINSELGKLVDGLKNTAAFAHNIGEGKLDTEYNLLSNDDQLGQSLLEMRQSLKKAQNEQTAHTKTEEQRNWGTAGLAKFAEILRQENDNMEDFAHSVISNLVKYLSANQGGMFILNDAENEEDIVLELKACYAFNRKKYEEKRIFPGEGLVGACYQERETIYLTEIPDSYITITSGLGGSTPKSVLICPLKVNDVVYGVVEIASFKEFEPYQIEFVEKVGESIAATISSVNVTMRTNKLLEQTRLQTEEMKNHEEELRQTMEEMQATQEEMRRRESELSETLKQMNEAKAAEEEQQYEMRQLFGMVHDTFNVVEFSHEGIIEKINNNLLDIFENATKEDFLGKPLSAVIGEETAKKAWEYLEKGIPFENMQNVQTGSEKIDIFNQKFKPILDNNGNLLRVVLLAILETEKEEIRRKNEELEIIHAEMKEVQVAGEEQMTKLSMVVEASKFGLWDMHVVHGDPVNPNNTFRWSDEFRKMLGYSDEADFPNVLGSWSEKLHPDDKQKTLDAFACHLLDQTGRTPYDIEYRLLKKNGEYGYFQALGTTTRDSEGAAIMVAGAIRDITEAKKNAAENEYQMAKLAMVIEASQLGLWDMQVIQGDPVNPNNIFTWSDEFRKMLGYSDETDFPNVLGSWSDKLHPEDKERTLDAFARHLTDHSGQTPYDLEYRLLKKNGEYGYFHAFGASTRDENGYAIRVAGALRVIE